MCHGWVSNAYPVFLGFNSRCLDALTGCAYFRPAIHGCPSSKKHKTNHFTAIAINHLWHVQSVSTATISHNKHIAFVCLKYAWEISISPHLQSYRILNRIHKSYQHKFTAINLIKPLTAIFSLNFWGINNFTLNPNGH